MYKLVWFHSFALTKTHLSLFSFFFYCLCCFRKIKVDLCFLPDVQKRTGANSCILMILDVFSRLAFASHQRNKSSTVTFQNFEKCLKHFTKDGAFPTYHLIASDRGTGKEQYSSIPSRKATTL